MTNPTRLVRELDASAIRARVDELDRERAALMVLLRAARRVQPQSANEKAATASRKRREARS
jgi:hypothetical protein